MSAIDFTPPWQRAEHRERLRRTLQICFGDRLGLAVFLGGLVFFGLYWRIGVFITDTNAIANTLVNVAHGHLSLTTAPYGAGFQAPGTYEAHGQPFGRDYGVVYLAVPVLWAFKAVAPVLDVRVLVVAAWSLLALGFAVTVGRIVDRQWVAVAGSVLALGGYAGSLAVATPIPAELYPVMALQIVTMVAAAYSGVLIYRLLARVHSPAVGGLAASAALLATPVGFWASLPKRHAFTALLVVAAAYLLLRSRDAATERRRRLFRALAYVPVGLTAVVHAAEGLALLVALVGVDFATAERNDRRSLGLVAAALALSLVPFFATNLAIAGNPLRAPRMLPSYGSGGAGLTEGFAGGSAGSGSAGGGAGDLNSIPVVSKAVAIATIFGSQLWDGIVVLCTEPARVIHTFVRSGYLPSVADKDGYQAINLAVLESAPLLGGLVAVPVVLTRRLRRGRFGAVGQHLRTPAGAVDAFVVAYAVVLVLLYLPRLPLHAQVTVRYLHPIFPLGVYGLVRLPAVAESLDAHWRLAAWTWTGGVLVGGQLVVVVLAVGNYGRGEAVQLHALLALATAGLLGLVFVAAAASERVPRRLGAVAFGLAAAAGTVFVLLSGIVYFAYAGRFALPVVRVLSDALALV
ncbi:MAG: hypothetical protein ABEJ31_15575 [Haloarculaceae archaeon]